MKRLQENRIEQLKKYLQACKLDPELFPEILDHLACEAEERLWDGNSFEQAYNVIVEAADTNTLRDLSVDHQNLLAMEKSLNDIVFEGRNKLYGAYALRKGYGQTMQRSVLLGVTLFLLMVMLPNLYATLMPEPKKDDIGFVVQIEDVTIVPDSKPLPPPVEEIVKPVEKTVKSTLLEVVQDNLADEDYTPPTVDDLANAKPAQQTNDGVEGFENVTPPVESVSPGKGKDIGLEPLKEETILDYAEQKPEFVGGNAAMTTFLQKNLKYPSNASRAGIQGKVFVQFTVGSDGRIESVKAVKGIGFGCDEEAERVIKLMPAWKPGKQSGIPVKVRFTMPIVFQME